MENQLEHLAQPFCSKVHDSAGEIISRDTRLLKLFLALPHFTRAPGWPPAPKGRDAVHTRALGSDAP